ARTPSPAVAGNVIDLGEPGDDESEDGGSAPTAEDGGTGAGGKAAGGTPRRAGPLRGLRRARSA
ncbi:hypothetical protein L7D48_28380, partial [Streptomyces sp. S1A]|nr:hypothetical protein [Streptomyces sp. ICN903]